MFNRKSFTLIEILVVVVIIAVLAALAWPNYIGIREKSLNREAKASLALVRAAEKIYRMEQGFYYPYLDTTGTTANINNFLKLGLPESATRSWTIDLTSPTINTGTGTATRIGVGVDGRQWLINFSGDTDPSCSGGSPASNCL